LIVLNIVNELICPENMTFKNNFFLKFDDVKKITINIMKKVFRKKDFENENGMLTSVWGPSLWHVLHCISFNYPINPTKEDKKNYANFIYSLQDVLPCRYCRINLPKNMKKLKFSYKIFRNRNTLSKWIYNLHREVNRMLGKKTLLTYCQVRERYEHFRARCSDKQTTKKQTTKKQTTKKQTTKKQTTKKQTTKKQTGGNREKGCTNSIYGIKSKCVLSIIPHDKKKQTFTMDPKCRKKRC